MKDKALPRLTLLAGLVLSCLVSSCRTPHSAPTLALSQNLLPSQAQVAEVRGFGCRSKQPGGSWHKLLLGDWLPMGSSVQTSAESSVTLRLYEAGIVVHVKPASEVRLEKLTYRKDAGGVITATRLVLSKGEVGVDNANLTPGSEFEILTPQGVTRIPPRGQN